MDDTLNGMNIGKGRKHAMVRTKQYSIPKQEWMQEKEAEEEQRQRQKSNTHTRYERKQGKKRDSDRVVKKICSRRNRERGKTDESKRERERNTMKLIAFASSHETNTE